MAKQTVNIGSAPNDGTGDNLRDGATKINDNFTEVYNYTNGFIDYNDTTGSISLVSDTWTTIPNDGQGAFSNDTYKPQGVTDLMDVSDGSIDPTQLTLGDTILIRNDFKINPNTNNALLEFRYQLGNGGGLYTLESTLGRLDDGSGKDYRFSLKPDLIYMGDTNTLNNPIRLQVKLSTNGTLLNAGSVIQLIKRNI
tara:strand:+ start:466 stop:1053 length:588 start_codon:yes stop_codon:yes gene_type:complete